MQDSDIENILGILHPFRRAGSSRVEYTQTGKGFVVHAYEKFRRKEVPIDLCCQWDDGYETVICRFVSSLGNSAPFELRVKDYDLLQGKMAEFIGTLKY